MVYTFVTNIDQEQPSAVLTQDKYGFKILLHDSGEPENFHVYVDTPAKTEAGLIEMMSIFKKDNCRDKCNIMFIDSHEAYRLLMYKRKELTFDKFDYSKEKYLKATLKWEKQHWPFVCERIIGFISFDVDNVSVYPYLDFYYKKMGGKKTKESLLK